jgi:2',3'-cyclic-nucleotide 2'-phosphodiesterase (5'-nucleotidase family)
LKAVHRFLSALFVVTLATLSCPHGGRSASVAFAQQEEAGAPRARAALTFLQINDVYATTPVDGAGGLARVATIKRRLSAGGRPVILALAGDFLSPSVASSVFKGKQMVAALNAAGLDVATVGNHEFDFGIEVLAQRMLESKFEWVVSNVLDARTGKAIGSSVPYVVRDVGSLKVGFIGLCLTSGQIAPGVRGSFRFIDPMQAAAQYIPVLERRGANAIVAITHLTFAEDRALAARFPQIDLVIGGHEHYPIAAAEQHALISKAGSDAKFVARIDVSRTPGGTLERFYELIPVTSAIPDEPETARVVADYESRLGKELDTVVGTTSTPLDATGVRMTQETALGNLVADALRADVDADVGLSNAGGVRGDRVYSAGPLTHRTLLTMHPFGNVVCKIAVSGRVLLDALNSGVSKLPAAAGQFPQLSGVTMKVDARGPPGNRVSDVRVNGAPLDLNKTYTVGLPDFVQKGGDNYSMFVGQKVLVDAQSGDLVVTALEKYIAAKREIAPAIDGRITIAR